MRASAEISARAHAKVSFQFSDSYRSVSERMRFTDGGDKKIKNKKKDDALCSAWALRS